MLRYIECNNCGRTNRLRESDPGTVAVCGECRTVLELPPDTDSPVDDTEEILWYMVDEEPPLLPRAPEWHGVGGYIKHVLTYGDSPEKEKYETELATYRVKLQEWRERQLKREEERYARSDWAVLHNNSRFAEVDSYSGVQFEEFVATLLGRMGWHVIYTKKGADQGADLIVRPLGGDQIAVQVKRSSQPVGVGALQSLLGGMEYYQCSKGIVVANRKFTEPAIRLAHRSRRISLWDRSKLKKLAEEHIPEDIPEFDWTEYHDLRNHVIGRSAQRKDPYHDSAYSRLLRNPPSGVKHESMSPGGKLLWAVIIFVTLLAMCSS